MYKKGKKEASSSLDLNSISESSSKGFNYLIGRAKGIYQGGSKERSRSTSHGSEESFGGRAFFNRGVSSDNGRRDGNSGTSPSPSPSIQDLNFTKPTFFRRTPAISTPLRPSWLVTSKPTRTGPSPLVMSPSSPNLLGDSIFPPNASDVDRFDVGKNGSSQSRIVKAATKSSSDLGQVSSTRKLESIPAEGSGKEKLPGISVSSGSTKVALPSLPLFASRDNDSRSFLDRPSSKFLTRHSSEDLRTQKNSGRENRSRTSSEDSVNGAFLGVSNPIRIGTARSLSPSTESPTLSSSAPTSSKAMHKSSSRSFSSTIMSTTTSNSSNHSTGSKSTSSRPIPFPTSASTPNLVSNQPTYAEDPRGSHYTKRDSQTILFQGFLQRKADYSPAVPAVKSSHTTNSPLSALTLPLPALPHSSSSIPTASTLRPPLGRTATDLDLQKGWKPYKVILKGSKLYLYKIPNGELTNTVKTLFPSTIVIDSSPNTSNPNSPHMSGIIEGEPRKKQRAFWGIGHHPGLMLNQPNSSVDTITAGAKGKEKESVVGGTCEGLVHELIFGTTFMDSITADDSTPSTSTSGYHNFSSVLLLFWPFLPFSSSQSSQELNRCASLAVRNLLEGLGKEIDPESDGKARALGKRLERIISTVVQEYPEDLYARGGSRKEASDTKAALQELIKLLASLEEIYEGVEVEKAISVELSEKLETAFESPITVAKHPYEWTHRPTFNRNGSSSSINASTGNAGISPSKTRKKPAALGPGDNEVSMSSFITNSSFLDFDAIAFTKQIYLFHLDRFKSLESEVSISRQFLNAAEGILPYDTPQVSVLSLFSFSAERPHFLTRLVLQTIFPSAIPNTNSPSPGVNENRTKIIERWITVGEELKRLGDTTGWIAIVLAICSRSVARLTEVWKAVNHAQLSLVRNAWVSMLAELGFGPRKNSYLVNGGIPYFGNILEESVKVLKEVKKTSDELVGAVNLLPLYELSKALQSAETVRNKANSIVQVPARPDLDLQYFFQFHSRLPATPISVSPFFATSLEVEPRLSGQYSELFYKPRITSDPSPLIPLIMVEPLPHISLVDRYRISQTSAGGIARKSSASGLAELAILQGKGPDPYSSRMAPGRLVRTNSFPPHVSSVDMEANVRYLAKIRSEMEPVGKFNDDTLTRLAKLKYEMENTAKLNDESLLKMMDGDLVFKINSKNVSPSLPATSIKGLLSRTASWIEARSSSRSSKASRRASVASISTLPTSLSRVTSILESGSSSKRSSMISNSTGMPAAQELLEGDGVEMLSVLVKSGTLESLVDLLVVGIDSALRTATTQGSSISLDAKRYRLTFFSTYRSFVSPMALLDLIRKRYISAPNAFEGPNRAPATLEKPFPDWSMTPILDLNTVDWKKTGKIRISIITSLEHWIDNHLQDFLDDEELFSSISAFLLYVQQCEMESGRLGRVAALEEIELLVKRFNSESLRPRIRSKRNLLAAAADDRKAGLSFDNLTVAELVDRLDQIASDVTRNVTESDLISYAETLEGSPSVNPIAWYSSRQLAKVDDEDVVITDPYSHLIALGLDSTILLQMPSSLRHGIQAHSFMRRWVLGHLVDPEISLSQRQIRMSKAVEIIELCRSRMSNVSIGGSLESQPSILDPSLASFVERVVTSAIVAPESRVFSSAWQGVANSRGVMQPDSLSSLIRKELVLTDSTSTIDFGWVTERLLEIVTQVDNLTEGASLNFEKRRLLFDFISNTLAIRPAQSGSSARYLESIEKRLHGGWGNWGMRILRDVASGEGTKVTKLAKPFQRLVNAQQEKIRRDRITREFVLKGKKLESIGRAQRDRDIAKAMERTVATRTRRMTAIFNRVTRPESPANVVTPSPTALQVQSLNGWMPTGKPFLVFALSGVQVVPLENGQRSFVFELATEEGQRSIFQATSKRDLDSWLGNLKQSGQSIAVRRATFLAQTALAEEPEELTITQPSNVKGVFGVPLWKVLKTEGSTIPIFIEKALEAIEERGLSEVGIYRISGENRVIHAMKDALNRGAEPADITANAYVHDLTGAVKLFLRELPEPVIPYNLYESFIAATEIEDYDARHFEIRDLTWKMPEPNFHLLRRLTEHLDRVTDNESVNSMFAANLSICFAPTLLKPDGDSFGLAMLNLGKAASVISSFILQQHWIFGSLESDPVDDLIIEESVEEEEDEKNVGLGVGIVDEEEPEGEEKVLPINSGLVVLNSSPNPSSGGDSFHSPILM